MVVSGSIIEVFRGQTVDRTSKRLKMTLPQIRAYLDELSSRPKYENNSLIYDPPLRCGSPYYESILMSHDSLKALREFGLDPSRSKFLIYPDIRKKSCTRSITTLQRVIHANAGRYTDLQGRRIPLKFLTLTFKREEYSDIVIANKQYTKYFRSLDAEFRSELGGKSLLYAGVHEPQKRGVIHYHVLLFNFPFAERVYSRLRKKWLSDSPQIRLIVPKEQNATGFGIQYLTKYIMKGISDDRLFRKKRYLSSRGLIRPSVTRDDSIIRSYEQIFDKHLIGGRDFSGEYFSGVARTYSLPRNMTVADYLKFDPPSGMLESVQQQLLFDDSMKELC